jgi:5-methylcytosine-specific restriction endonuclease McrA
MLKVGGKFTAEQIDELHAKQRGKCANCRTPIGQKTYHRDHIVALSRGGSNDISNIQLLCIPCNRRKYNKCPIEFAQAHGRLL